MLKGAQILAIIVTFNGAAFIGKCLDRLKKNIDVRNVIIVDNDSKDATVSIIGEKYKEARLIRLDRNYGFGRANNVGLQIALSENADYVLLLNQDVYVDDYSIRKLVELATLYPAYGILSPMHLNGKGTALDNHFAGYVASTLVSDLFLGRPAQIYPCHFVNAAAWLISKKCLRTVGGFDPLFFHYGEDDDYLNRVRYFKMKIGVCPGVRIFHDRGPANALSTYPAADKMYLEILKKLKNINSPFSRMVVELLLQLLANILIGLFFFQFKNIKVMVKVFFRTILRIRRIRDARTKSKTECAFINSPSI
jgi:GT2 family glycosyltransferase